MACAINYVNNIISCFPTSFVPKVLYDWGSSALTLSRRSSTVNMGYMEILVLLEPLNSPGMPGFGCTGEPGHKGTQEFHDELGKVWELQDSIGLLEQEGKLVYLEFKVSQAKSVLKTYKPLYQIHNHKELEEIVVNKRNHNPDKIRSEFYLSVVPTHIQAIILTRHVKPQNSNPHHNHSFWHMDN